MDLTPAQLARMMDLSAVRTDVDLLRAFIDSSHEVPSFTAGLTSALRIPRDVGAHEHCR